MKPISKASRVGRTDKSMKLTSKLDEYQRKDYRTKCALCQRYMRYNPTPKSPARRRQPPHAGTCTECPIIDTNGDKIRFIHEELLYN